MYHFHYVWHDDLTTFEIISTFPIIFLGFAFLTIPLTALMGGSRGHYVDLNDHSFCQFHKRTQYSTPKIMRRIALGQIKAFLIDHTTDHRMITLTGHDGEKLHEINFSDLPNPPKQWAESIQSIAPHICIEII